MGEEVVRMTDEPKYLTITQAAEVLGVDRKKIRRMIRDGQLQAIVNPIDKRERLVPRTAIESLAEFASTKKAAA
jgi:excisionase family DNA binding protein